MKTTLLFIATLFSVGACAQTILLDEGFDDITTLDADGYLIMNVSDAPSNDIFQGNPDVFGSFDGDSTSYLASNFNSTTGSIVDVYILLPQLDLTNGDQVSFYTTTGEGSEYPDRLEVRLDPDGTEEPPFPGGDPGSYTELLLSINPDLTVGGYPEVWTQQVVTISGLDDGVTETTRIALRYWVTDGGPAGSNSNFIGIDRLVVTANPAPSSIQESVLQDMTHVLDGQDNLTLAARGIISTVNVYDLSGRIVMAEAVNNTGAIVSMAHLNRGVYIVEVASEGDRQSFKIGLD